MVVRSSQTLNEIDLNVNRRIRTKIATPRRSVFKIHFTLGATNITSIYNGYTGFVQRISGERAAVLFEGGNWDKLITIPLSDLVLN